ncbi:MAG: SURF1 family cytochrome oxidase biogenesis protein [Rothia sp. (in: high G+C Gram-positive bacteria)]|nr:SURF1 family cytochrome oxidase biogenesis protein [Rothia sp. (in: high G+C Gram-positive bacteria)]
MLKTALTPRWLLGLLAVLALASGFVMLSAWQLNSSTLGMVSADPAKDKVQPFEQVLAPYQVLTQANVDSMVEVTGSYLPASSYLVEGKLKDGQEGYWVLALFIPEGSQQVKTSLGQGPRGIAVARGWTAEAQIPQEPEGQITLAGRLVANDPPLTSQDLSEENRGKERVLASANSSYLTNVWNAALYNGILTLDSEALGPTPLTEQGSLSPSASLLDGGGQLQPVGAEQVTDDSVDWLNIFYALEWLVFAGFALFLWFRLLKDSAQRQQDPALYFEYEGQYWTDPVTGRPYYFDPADQTYYFFDDINPEESKQ